jgi:hypothetical protein
MAQTKLDALDWASQQGYLGDESMESVNEFTVMGDRVEQTKTVVVHSFTMEDVEDPDLYAAEPLMAWQNSEVGLWVMDNAVETPSWHRTANSVDLGYRYQIRARLRGAALTEWFLRHGK